MKKYTSLSYEVIGQMHAVRDHASVNYACKTVEDRVSVSKVDRETLEHLCNCVELTISAGLMSRSERRYKKHIGFGKRKKPTLEPAPLRKQTKN